MVTKILLGIMGGGSLLIIALLILLAKQDRKFWIDQDEYGIFE